YLDEADRLADRIGVIDHGRMIAEGTSNQLKAQVGGDVVEIHVAEADCASAAAALTRVVETEPKIEGGSLTVPAAEGPRTLAAVVRELDAAGVEPTDIALRKPTLDDVFLTLTGHRAEDRARPVVNAGRRRRR
ncbi:MAG TPA: DUF4162 domain-containing protein, partial [Acidimicrobiia bacterium]|nr:DUF4162 domain-containing protein [Acidimicrobiia bacterium]